MPGGKCDFYICCLENKPLKDWLLRTKYITDTFCSVQFATKLSMLEILEGQS